MKARSRRSVLNSKSHSAPTSRYECAHVQIADRFWIVNFEIGLPPALTSSAKASELARTRTRFVLPCASSSAFWLGRRSIDGRRAATGRELEWR